MPNSQVLDVHRKCQGDVLFMSQVLSRRRTHFCHFEYSTHCTIVSLCYVVNCKCNYSCSYVVRLRYLLLWPGPSAIALQCERHSPFRGYLEISLQYPLQAYLGAVVIPVLFVPVISPYYNHSNLSLHYFGNLLHSL